VTGEPLMQKLDSEKKLKITLRVGRAKVAVVLHEPRSRQFKGSSDQRGSRHSKWARTSPSAAVVFLQIVRDGLGTGLIDRGAEGFDHLIDLGVPLRRIEEG
jgi:hypothetical protein